MLTFICFYTSVVCADRSIHNKIEIKINNFQKYYYNLFDTLYHSCLFEHFSQETITIIVNHFCYTC